MGNEDDKTPPDPKLALGESPGLPTPPVEQTKEQQRIDRIFARPPHVGERLRKGKSERDALLLMLALTAEIEEAERYAKAREEEARLRGKAESVDIVEEAIRRKLNKPTGQITAADLASVTHLTLSGTQLGDLTPLRVLAGLRQLFARRTRVSDLTPLENLTELEELNVAGTRVRNLEPLEDLPVLRRLVLRRTGVSNLGPLRELKKLEYLNLADTRVIDVKPLAGLTELKELSLRGTKVETVEPLSDLKNLKTLDLVGTQVSDVTPLKHIKGLKIHGP